MADKLWPDPPVPVSADHTAANDRQGNNQTPEEAVARTHRPPGFGEVLADEFRRLGRTMAGNSKRKNED